METLGALLETLRAALAKWTTTLKQYLVEVGTAGPRALGSRWGAVAASLEAEPETGDPDRAGDRLEQRLRVLTEATTALVSTAVRSAARSGMSRTYSDNIEAITRAVLRAKAIAEDTLDQAVAAAKVAPLPPGAATPALGLGRISTELYIRAALDQGGTEAAARLGDAADAALGLPADTPEALAEDARALGEYHPSQAMAYTPRVGGAPGLLLPGADRAVEYDLARLIDRAEIRKFGPPATFSTGLNYRLVDRLRSIRYASESPLQENNSPAEEEGSPTPNPEWGPLSGPRPRVGRYGELCTEIICDLIRADRVTGWGAEIWQGYERASPPTGGEDRLVSSLIAAFGRAETDYVETLDEGTFVIAGVAEASAIGLEALERALSVPAARIVYSEGMREARLSQAIQVTDTARALGRRLRPGREEVAPPKKDQARLIRGRIETAVKEEPLALAPAGLKVYAITGMKY